VVLPTPVQCEPPLDSGLELDLGDDGPLLVFGGPYSNLQATEALFLEAKRLGVSSDRMLCTGDVVAYCGDPLATVQRVRSSGITVVMGNCEEQLGKCADNCGCGFSPSMTCHALSREWYAFASSELDEGSRAWMRGLPRRVQLRFAGRRLAAIHGGVNQINRFVFESSPWWQKDAEILAVRSDGVLAGHSGIPFTQIANDRLWHNAGVIGMPANDRQSTTWYSLLRSSATGIRIEHRQLEYPHYAAAEKMRRVGLSHHYANALAGGLWPSLDILPKGECDRTGFPIPPSVHHWSDAQLHAKRPLEPALVVL
jgi:predicted phosphodiesterase